jgi:hypothetical protein
MSREGKCAFESLSDTCLFNISPSLLQAMTYDVDLNDKEYGDLGFDKVAALGLMALGGFYIVIAFLLDYSPAILSGLINLQGLPQRPDYDL